MAAPLRRHDIRAVMESLRPGITVFVPGMSGESLAFYEQFCSDPERAAGITFVGVHFPGINCTDYLGLHPEARLRAYFMSPSVRSGIVRGRVDLMPLDYPGIVRDLEQGIAVDMAIAQVAPPDENGRCSLGACQDFLPSVWRSAGLRIAHVNPRLPRTRGSFSISLGDCDFIFERDCDIPTLAADVPDSDTLQHGGLVAKLVPDGATLQLGIGRLQTAILMSLKNHRRLRVYSGMVSPAVMELLDGGAIQGDGAIECGVALGDSEFYARLDSDPVFYFRPSRETHDIRRIASITDFCAINSALEVDLFGQVNVDYLNGRLVAGVGGLPAFSAGARLAPGGRSIIVVPSTAEGGRRSRIVCPEHHSLSALGRHEADYVVTEHGVAQLRGLSVHDRAKALISVAAPEFQDGLARAWGKIERRL